jgi:hypothetical protein
MAHILFRATLDGLIIRGPMIGREHAFALVADWLASILGRGRGDGVGAGGTRFCRCFEGLAVIVEPNLNGTI